MWWRLGVLAVGVAALLVVLFWPLQVDIRVDLPPVRGGGASMPAEDFAFWAAPAVVALILLGAFWLGRGIVRKHGRPR